MPREAPYRERAAALAPAKRRCDRFGWRMVFRAERYNPVFAFWEEANLQPELAAAVAQITAAGQPHETRVERIRGVDFTVFANAPENLRVLYESSLAHADKDFYVYQDERFTYQRMWDAAAQCANRLCERGIKPGDRVESRCATTRSGSPRSWGSPPSARWPVAMNAWWSGEELLYASTIAVCSYFSRTSNAPNASSGAWRIAPWNW